MSKQGVRQERGRQPPPTLPHPLPKPAGRFRHTSSYSGLQACVLSTPSRAAQLRGLLFNIERDVQHTARDTMLSESGLFRGMP